MDKTSTGQHTTIHRNTGLHTTEPYLFSEDALSLESDGEASSVLPEPMEHGQTIYYLAASLVEGVDNVLNEQYNT